MTEILIATWSAVIGVLSGVWDLLETVLVWAGSILYHLHVDAPRLEGLLVGVILTWFLLRRDRHPALRVLSAPLKLIVDILDLVWDRLIEVCVDSKDAVLGWTGKAVSPVISLAKKSWSKLLDSLKNLREKLKKSKNEKAD